MISEKIKQTILTENTDKIKALAEYKQFLSDNKFSLKNAFNPKALEDELKVQLFQKLIAVDKGVAYRFGMLKDEKLKADFISDKVNVLGYSEIDKINYYNKVIESGLKGDGYHFGLITLVEVELDVNKIIEKQLIDWAGVQMWKDANDLATALNVVYQLHQKCFPKKYDNWQNGYNFLHDLMHSKFKFDFDNNKIVVNEMTVAREYFGKLEAEAEHQEYLQFQKEEAVRMKTQYKK